MRGALRLAVTTAVLFRAADAMAQRQPEPAPSDEAVQHATVAHEDSEADRKLHPTALRLNRNYMGMFQDEPEQPGWCIDAEANDREFTFEFGVRIFY